MFVGREKELNLLNDIYDSKKSEIIVVYGRRRIGKSTLIKEFIKKKKNLVLEGIEGKRTADQIKYSTQMLQKQINDPVLQSISFKSWDNFLTYITDRFINKRKEKKILFFDEIQWMANDRSTLISLIKYYWDNFWKDNNVMLILCGSIASFMVQKVVNSKALYGRIGSEILLKGLNPNEAVELFNKKKSSEEILKYLLILGTVPKYLENIDQSKSFNKNINSMFFNKFGKMANEIEKMFYSQFKETKIYLDIVSKLKSGILSMDEIAGKIKIKSGGGLKRYLTNLENAEFIKSHIPYNKKINSKIKAYSLSDEYLLFYFKYIEPNRRIINESSSEKLFETFTFKNFEIWMGFQFEKFCIKNALIIAEILGFNDEVLIASPYFERGDNSFQIDMVYIRSDKVITVCEIKYWNKEVTTKVIADMKKKIKLLKIPRGYSVETVLISLYGPNQSLKEAAYFDSYVDLKDIFRI